MEACVLIQALCVCVCVFVCADGRPCTTDSSPTLQVCLFDDPTLLKRQLIQAALVYT